MSAANLAAALVSAQKEMPPVRPDGKADTGKFKYEYVTLDHLIAVTRPVLQSHGLAIVQAPGTAETGQPILRTTLVHESGETLVLGDVPLLVGEKSMQQLGSAITYARRYAWAAALGISAEADDDGASAGTKQKGQAKPKPEASSDEPKPTVEELAEFVKLAEACAAVDKNFQLEGNLKWSRTASAAELKEASGSLQKFLAEALGNAEAQTTLEATAA